MDNQRPDATNKGSLLDEEYKTDDIVNEIFDIVNPKEAGKISLKDLLACKNVAVVLRILINIEGFADFEGSRESG